MERKLKDYFPMIQTRGEVLAQIQSQPLLQTEYESWGPEIQEEFLDFCTGVRGGKMTYDGFFKEIMNPEYHPERLEHLLSLLLKKKVHIAQVLPNDSVRITDENALIITDVVVQFEDGSLANVEIQKIGYAFPGERSACYSSDLVLRQYRRVRSIRKKKFTYRDIKNVYVIVLFEESPVELREFMDIYVHHAKQTFDSGLQINLLQEYIYISLDIFKENMQYRSIGNELEAWLAFFGFDDPKRIMELVEAYPEFRAMYEDVYSICKSMEGVMGMFSKELYELDRNTAQYMIEERETKLKELDDELKALDDELKARDDELKARDDELKAQKAKNEALSHRIAILENALIKK